MAPRGKYDRSQSPALRRREQRTKLLASAAKVFAATGYSQASVEAIIQDAGMSRRTFYEHFDDLHGVLLELHTRTAKFAIGFVRDAIESAPNPIAGIEAGIRTFLELSAGNADLARVLFREVRASGDDERREALENAFAKMLLAALRRAHENGDISIAPEPVAVTGLVGAIETVAMRLVEHRREAGLKQAAPVLLRMTLNAFRETEPHRPASRGVDSSR